MWFHEDLKVWITFTKFYIDWLSMDSVPFRREGGKSASVLGTAKTTKSRHNLWRQSDRENDPGITATSTVVNAITSHNHKVTLQSLGTVTREYRAIVMRLNKCYTCIQNHMYVILNACWTVEAKIFHSHCVIHVGKEIRGCLASCFVSEIASRERDHRKISLVNLRGFRLEVLIVNWWMNGCQTRILLLGGCQSK